MANTICAKCKREWQADAPDEECPFCKLARIDDEFDEFFEGDVEPDCREPESETVVCPDCDGHGYLFGDGYVDSCTKCGTEGHVPKEQA